MPDALRDKWLINEKYIKAWLSPQEYYPRAGYVQISVESSGFISSVVELGEWINVRQNVMFILIIT